MTEEQKTMQERAKTSAGNIVLIIVGIILVTVFTLGGILLLKSIVGALFGLLGIGVFGLGVEAAKNL